MEKRLGYSRIKGRFEDKPLIPFTNDFVEFIYEIAGGKPEKIISICDHVLDAGIAQRKDLLDKNFAQKVVEERNI
jgi:hypothetical protein